MRSVNVKCLNPRPTQVDMRTNGRARVIIGTMKTPRLVSPCISLLLAVRSFAADPALKTEHFDRDPGWEEYNNHVAPKKTQLVKQDFGYSAKTNFAGKAKGEMGGTIQ